MHVRAFHHRAVQRSAADLGADWQDADPDSDDSDQSDEIIEFAPLAATPIATVPPPSLRIVAPLQSVPDHRAASEPVRLPSRPQVASQPTPRRRPPPLLPDVRVGVRRAPQSRPAPTLRPALGLMR